MKKPALLLAGILACALATTPQAQQNDDEATIKQADRTLSYNPRDYDARLQRAESYFRLGKIDQALADYSKLIEMGESPHAYFKRGECYLYQAEKQGVTAAFNQAIADYTKAIELDPANAYPFFSRAQAYRQQGQFGKAIADYDKAIALVPNNVWFFFFRAQAHEAKGDYAAAIADWNSAMKHGFDDSLKKNIKEAQAKMK